MVTMDHLTHEWMMMRYEQCLAEARADRAADIKMARRIKALSIRLGRNIRRMLARRSSTLAIATPAPRRDVIGNTSAT